MIVALGAAALAFVPVHAGTNALRAPVSLVAIPAHVSLTGNARQIVTVTNSGSRAVVVDVSRAGYALDLRGRPKVVRQIAGRRATVPWLTVRPSRLALPPGGSASLSVLSRLPRRAEPGDRGALVLLTTRPIRNAAVSVRMRLGVVVVVRAPGAIVHRLDLLRLRLRAPSRPRLLELWVANRGNVTEQLSPSCLSITLSRAGRVLARPRAVARLLLPRTQGIVELRSPRSVRGRVTVQVQPSARARCGVGLRGTLRARL